jgi:hypothetical protein
MATYTEDQVVEMKAAYQAAVGDAARKQVVTELAERYNVTRQSVIGKLVSAQVYVKAEPTTKTGARITSKDEYVKAISILLGLPELESLGKASKGDLRRISDRLVEMSEKVNLTVAK